MDHYRWFCNHTCCEIVWRILAYTFVNPSQSLLLKNKFMIFCLYNTHLYQWKNYHYYFNFILFSGYLKTLTQTWDQMFLCIENLSGGHIFTGDNDEHFLWPTGTEIVNNDMPYNNKGAQIPLQINEEHDSNNSYLHTIITYVRKHHSTNLCSFLHKFTEMNIFTIILAVLNLQQLDVLTSQQTRRRPNVGSLLALRLRYPPKIEPTLGQCLLYAG